MTGRLQMNKSDTKVTPFSFINEINGKQQLSFYTDITQTQYIPFIINRGLSYFADTIIPANEMNIHPDLDRYLQYRYFCSAVNKRPRFSKWASKTKDDNLIAVATIYNCGLAEAREIIDTISEQDTKMLIKMHE